MKAIVSLEIELSMICSSVWALAGLTMFLMLRPAMTRQFNDGMSAVIIFQNLSGKGRDPLKKRFEADFNFQQQLRKIER